MINTKTSFFKVEYLFMLSIIIPFIIMTSLLISQGHIFVTIGIYLCVCICLILKSLENIFLFWLLIFSFFSTDPIYYLTFGSHPVFTFDRVIIGTLSLLVLMQVLIKQRKLITEINKIEVVMLLFFLVIIYSSTKTQSEYHGLRGILDIFIIPFTIYFLAKNLVQNKNQLRKFINILIMLGISLSFMGIYEAISKNDLFPSSYGLAIRSGWLRVNGPYNQDTVFGVSVVICFFVVLYKFSTLNKEKRGIFINKILYILILCLLSVAIGFNFYRGIWLSLALGLLFWFTIRKKRWKEVVIYAFILLLILIPLFNKIQDTYLFHSRISNIDTIMIRLYKFRVLIDEFKQNPITGIGLFNHFNIKATSSGSHNIYLAILVEMGILGISMFLLLIAAMFQQGIKNYRMAINDSDKELSVLFACILIVYLISGVGLLTSYLSGVNKLFFAIAGVLSNKLYFLKECR